MTDDNESKFVCFKKENHIPSSADMPVQSLYLTRFQDGCDIYVTYT